MGEIQRNAARSPSPAQVRTPVATQEKLLGGASAGPSDTERRPVTALPHTGSALLGLQLGEHAMTIRPRLRRLDEESYCALRLGVGILMLICGNAVTGLATRSAFSGAANKRGALQDRMHEWIGYCDQAGQSTLLGRCPAFWQPITDMLPDKLVLGAMIMTMCLYVAGAWRQRSLRVLTRLLAETCGLWSLLLCLRAAVVAATIMPAPSPLCRNATQWAQGPGGRPTKGWFLTPIDCNDAMFSGHTCTYVLRPQSRPALIQW